MIKIKNILTAIDFSSHEDAHLHFDQPNINVLKYGCELANRFEADLYVLHVIQEITVIEFSLHELEREAQKKLDSLAIELSNPQAKIVRTILKGRPFIEIIKYAKEHAIDLIVIGTHGHKALSHVLIGSEAENIARKSPCPVLIVRYPEHEFIMP